MNKKEKILVVDDDLLNIKLVETYLSNLGYSIIVAHNGEEALERVSSEEINLMLLDVMMPGLNGFEVCRHVRRIYNQTMPIILLTTLNDVESKVAGFEWGADDFLTKPFHKDELLVRVKAHLRISSLRDEIEELNRTLEEKVVSRTQTIQNINKELLTSNQELERFAYAASHDLQEPLRMVVSFTQLLEKKYKDKLDTQAKEYIDFAVDGAKRMQTLIDDLLSFSLVTYGNAPRTKVDLNEICKRVLENLSMTIADNQVIVQWDPLPVIYANEIQMTQLFTNLISNGIKYRSERSPVIKIISTDQAPRQWQFSISDNGIGIDEKYFGKLFVLFQRLHTKKVYKGTGIGLALCKKIVEIYDGRIWIESKLDEGTTFHFILKEEEKESLENILKGEVNEAY